MWVRIPPGLEIFFSFSVRDHFLSRAIVQKVSVGIFIQHFSLPHLNHCTVYKPIRAERLLFRRYQLGYLYSTSAYHI